MNTELLVDEPSEPRPIEPRPSEPRDVLPREAAIPASKTLETCDAVIIALACKRFVIARQDQAKRLRPVQRLCKPLHQLKPGDRVYYQGQAVEVEAIEVY